MMNRLRLIASSLLALSLAACSSSSSGNGTSSGGAAGQPGPGNESGAAEGSKFFLPTGANVDNTSAPTLEVDAQGNTHAIYPAYAGGGAYYAFCGAGCNGPKTTKVVRFDTDGTVANAMIALDGSGHPRVLLSSFSKVYFASCEDACGEQGSWKVGAILEHGGDREVSGEALALDPKGHPRFLFHTYRAYLGIGQKTPETLYATCDADCTSAAAWKTAVVGTDIWEGTHLRFDSKGAAHAATVLPVGDDKKPMAAYMECTADCGKEDSWKGIGLGEVFTSEYEAVGIKPTVSLALTKAGAPRIAFIGKKDDGKKAVIYQGCDTDCSADHWKGTMLTDSDKISAGVDLALDANDFPRIVFALNYNIGLSSCQDAHCENGETKWEVLKVESGDELPADQIFLETNCTVGAWFFHSPSIALTADGHPRVGYQARDISGGVTKPEPNKPGCTAGTDMTWSRVAFLGSARGS